MRWCIQFLVKVDQYDASKIEVLEGLREYVGVTFEDALNQVIIELEQEFS